MAPASASGWGGGGSAGGLVIKSEGGSGGGVSSNVTPGSDGMIRVLPTWRTGRVAFQARGEKCGRGQSGNEVRRLHLLRRGRRKAGPVHRADVGLEGGVGGIAGGVPLRGYRAGIRSGPLFAWRQRSPSGKIGAAQPVNLTGVKHGTHRRLPDPSDICFAEPTAVVVRQPAPGIVADPSVADGIEIAPAALFDKAPSLRRLQVSRPSHPQQVPPGPLPPLTLFPTYVFNICWSRIIACHYHTECHIVPLQEHCMDLLTLVPAHSQKDQH